MKGENVITEQVDLDDIGSEEFCCALQGPARYQRMSEQSFQLLRILSFIQICFFYIFCLKSRLYIKLIAIKHCLIFSWAVVQEGDINHYQK